MVCAELLKSSRHYVQAQVLTFTILWRLLLLPPFRRERLSNLFRASKSVNTLSIQDLPYTMQNNWHVLSKSWQTSCLWVDLTIAVPLSVRFLSITNQEMALPRITDKPFTNTILLSDKGVEWMVWIAFILVIKPSSYSFEFSDLSDNLTNNKSDHTPTHTHKRTVTLRYRLRIYSHH